MTVFKNSAENAAAAEGTTADATSTASGGAGDALSTTGTAGTRVFTLVNPLHGLRSYLVTPSGVSGTCAFLKSGLTWTRMSARVYYRFDVAPAASTTIVAMFAGGTPALRVQMSSTRTLLVQNFAGTTVSTSPALTVDTWYRLEMVCIPGADTATGTLKFKLFAGDSTTALHTFETTTGNAGTAALTNVQFGKATSNTTVQKSQWDDFMLSDETSDYLGPEIIPVIADTQNVSAMLPARNLQRAFIGDSTLYQDGNGYANLKAMMTANGFDTTDTGTGSTRKFFHYAAIGKAINSNSYTTPDSNGKTTFQNIDDARAAFGGDPTGGYIINLGSNGAGSTDAVNTARFNDTMNYIGSTVPVVWIGLWNGPTLDAPTVADRTRLNTLFKSLVAARPNAIWANWPAYGDQYSSLAIWNSDQLHHTTLGYQIKNNFYIKSLPGSPVEVAQAAYIWNGATEITAAIDKT